uniref:Uncharacterized protein n=1 Tax=Pithovirus LCPAC406 TaxID=2506599 RepID=A0A481ZEV1_9VIRU|nr:MAG: uncharacterized protein LCPAC406_00460 [Pithovirus LCPAC406]
MYSYQGTWTSNDEKSGVLEIDLPIKLESVVKANAIFSGLEYTMVGTYNNKLKMLKLTAETGYIASMYTTSLTIIGNVLSNTIVGTFGLNTSGTFELTYYSKEDIEKKNRDIKIKEIKDIITEKGVEVDKILTEVSELSSQLADLECPKMEIHSNVLIVNRV